jgi:DNA-binding SARP family transcriptional activator
VLFHAVTVGSRPLSNRYRDGDDVVAPGRVDAILVRREEDPMALRESPPNVAHAVVRSGVLGRLDARWDRTVTTVVAGAGFGKSVALGQAMRANRARPRGIEGWVPCRTGCETPERLAAAVEAAYGGGAGQGPPLARLLAVVTDRAPLHVSLVLDDVDLLPDACVTLLDDLLRRAPANLHLVLAGRRLPPLALARFRAADDVVELDADLLRFDGAEVAALAANLGAGPPAFDLAGWPALVRLALVSPRRAVDEYLWEEVIRSLGPGDRGALLALCLLGPSRLDEVEAVTARPFDHDGFLARVPLVHRIGDRVVAHDLWTPYLEALGTAFDVEAMAHRVVTVVAVRGDPIATGAIALRLDDDEALDRATVDLVRTTLGSLPVGVAEAWLAARRPADPGEDRPAAAELLDCALAHARDGAQPSTGRLDAVADLFRSRGDHVGEGVALALGALVANDRDDFAYFVSLGVRARGLAARGDEPVLGLLVQVVDAAGLALGGDIDAALALLARPVPGVDPAEVPEALTRLHWHFLILGGRAGDAADLTAEVSPVPGMDAPRELQAVARWFDGDPTGLLTGTVDVSPARYHTLSERDRFEQATLIAAIAASADRPDAVRDALDVLATSPFAAAAGPDGALTVVARAAGAVADRDDDRAAELIAAFLASGPPDRVTDTHLRRALAVPYVCSPDLRRAWDAADLGPSQRRARAAARLLVDARTGRVPTRPDVPLPAVCTALPLPWSVELAVRAAATAAWGAELAVLLTDLFGDGVPREITRRGDDADAGVRRGVAAVLRALPSRPAAAVGIGVLGPLEVRLDDVVCDAAEVHRTRVRELLSLLVAERTVSRDRVVDELWPDLDPGRGRANLRVTLRHLQRVLEPDRGQGSAPYFLRGDTQQLVLADVPGLAVDLWAAEDHLARAEAARRAGDAAGRIEHLRAVAGLWRGRPLADLDRVADADHLSRHLEARLADAAVTLGELELVGGAAGAAATLAARVLGSDPYAERAHRLAVAAHMQAGDRSATAAAVDRFTGVLAELGAPTEPATQILLRNAGDWLAPVTTRPGSR